MLPVFLAFSNVIFFFFPFTPKARMAALGVRKHAEDLTSYFSAAKPGKRPWRKSPIPPMELRRRSERLKNILPASGLSRRSERLKNILPASGLSLLFIDKNSISYCNCNCSFNFNSNSNFVEGNSLNHTYRETMRYSQVLATLRIFSRISGFINLIKY